MKTLFFLLLPAIGFAQPKIQAVIDGGLTSWGTLTARGGGQLFIGEQAIVDVSFRYTEGNYFVESASAGFTKDFEKMRLIITGGVYYHQYKFEEKGATTHFMRPGGQLQLQYGVGICGVEWNGEFAALSVGIALFNPKEPQSQ